MSAPAEPALSVVVPATDEPPTLARCADALAAALGDGDELIVVTEPRGAGPAEARNAGAVSAGGEVIVFVDSDVVVHPTALERIRTAFAADASLDAVFGAYDDRPEAGGAASGFRNLLHHHVHHSAAGPASTFWAGLGAIRRAAFERAGGFHAERFPDASIEDVELGIRMTRAGARIELDPRIQGTHLKRWTVAGMVHTDLARRGIPWARLLLEPGAPRGVLNLGWRHRLSALAALSAVAAVPLGRRRLAFVAALVLVSLNWSLYVLIWRSRGPRAAVAGVGLHALHHLTGVIALAIALLSRALPRRHMIGRDRARGIRS